MTVGVPNPAVTTLNTLPPTSAWQIGGVSVLTLPTTTVEYVKIPVTSIVNGVFLDPTSDPVDLAFLATFDKPDTGDWHTGTWTAGGGGLYYARCLIGPGSGVGALTAGTWQVWLRLTATPETVVRLVGQIEIF